MIDCRHGLRPKMGRLDRDRPGCAYKALDAWGNFDFLGQEKPWRWIDDGSPYLPHALIGGGLVWIFWESNALRQFRGAKPKAPLEQLQARMRKLYLDLGGWLYVAELHIINTSGQAVSLRPYLLIELAQIREPTRMTLTPFDLEQMEFDRPSTRRQPQGLGIKVELLKEQPYWLSKDTLPYVDKTNLHTGPIRLQPGDEITVKLAFFMTSHGVARTGASFFDKQKPGVWVSDKMPPALELGLFDAISETTWKTTEFTGFSRVFSEMSDLRAPPIEVR